MCLKTRNVLLINSDDTIKEMMLLCLETIPQCRVTTVNSRVEVMENITQTDVILLDLDENPSEIGWQDLVCCLQQNPTTNNIPLILLTATPHSQKILEFQRTCNVQAIAKTFNLMNLADRIAQLLNWN